MKKVLAVIMALAMVLSLTVAVSADDPVIKEGDVTFTVEAEWWEMHDMKGVIFDSADDLANISKIVFTTTSPGVLICYSSVELVDESKNGHWQQTPEAITEFTIEGSDILLEETTDTDGNVSPYIYVCASTTAGTEVAVHYVVYGKDAPADAAPADEGTAGDGTAADDNTVAPTDGGNTADAPSTGIALAVIPAVVAMAAVAVSKKH